VVQLLIKVKPNSSKDEISVDEEGNISVKIRAKPIDGEANEYLVKFLAKEFGISKALIQIDKGATSRLKRISINIEESGLKSILNKYQLNR
jgi:uncharacterized protein (TIGR00251 family)